MNDHAPTFLKRLKGLTLSANERLQMRERLAAYADMHAVPETAVPAFGSFFSFMGSRRFSTYAAALLLIALIGGSVTLAAEGSVPGDSLYAVKIDVNEPLMTALATTPSGQAKVAANIATRRIDEAVTLESRHELTPDRQTYLAQQFDERVKVAAKKASDLAMLDSSAAIDVRENLAANLAGEAQALGAVSAGDTDGAKDLLSVVVSASESISDSANPPPIAGTDLEGTSTEEASSTEGVASEADRIERAAGLLSSTSASTTNLRQANRFSKHLRIASTTLQRVASSSLQTGSILLPHLDVAIPLSPVQPSFASGEDSNGERLGD